MAQLPQGRFDATQVDPSQNFEPIPADDYLMCITASELAATRDGSGQFIKFDLDVIDGQYKGRKVFDRLNIRNKSQQAEEIAYRTLSAICHATGKMQVTDTVELHNTPMLVTVAQRKYKTDSGEERISNEVKGYKPAAAQTMQMPAQSTPPQTAQATRDAPPATASTPPWARKAS